MLASACFTVLAVAPLVGGCIPYAVGTTAATVPPGEPVPSGSIVFVPAGFAALVDTSAAGPRGYTTFDAEVRFGLDERSDVGVRIVGASGVVVNYKHRIGPRRAAVDAAFLVGGGVVNLGSHAHLEATCVVSGAERATLTPYGGVRAMHVIPLYEEAVTDTPTVGGFVGVRIGEVDLGVSPEIAVYHDRSALGLRDADVIVVPSFTLHGARLLRLLGGMW